VIILSDVEKRISNVKKVYYDLKKLDVKRRSPNYHLWRSTIYLAKSTIHKLKFGQQLRREEAYKKRIAK